MEEAQPNRPAGRPGEVGHAVVNYPGGIRVRYSWGNSGRSDEVFALAEVGLETIDLGSLVSEEPDRLCRAELEIRAPARTSLFRLASRIYDQPEALYWDGPGLLLVKYGFVAYAIDPRRPQLEWLHRSATPLVAVIGSSQLDHVLLQGQLETFAVAGDGSVRWRLALTEVVAEAEMIGGVLVLTSVDGEQQAIDPRTGETRR